MNKTDYDRTMKTAETIKASNMPNSLKSSKITKLYEDYIGNLHNQFAQALLKFKETNQKDTN